MRCWQAVRKQWHPGLGSCLLQEPVEVLQVCMTGKLDCHLRHQEAEALQTNWAADFGR